MNLCIFDVKDECTHDCDGCSMKITRCSLCGCRDGELFRCGSDILCGSCIADECGDDYYADFAAEYKNEFRSFVILCNAKNRISGCCGRA